MQAELQGVDLTKQAAVIPDALAAAITTLRGEIVQTPAPSRFRQGLDAGLQSRSAERAADRGLPDLFVADDRRAPTGSTASWTQNWPFEPLVGNTPTTSTFLWTWISFCFTFFAFGAVLFIYQRYLNDPDQAPMDPVLARFRPLDREPAARSASTFSSSPAVLLLQILVGSIMAHYYTDRTSFYGIAVDRFLPFNFLRDVHIQSPIVWIGLSWIGAALFLAPAISGGEPKGQGFLVDVLFWVTLFIVVGALAGNYLGIMGYIREGWFWFGNQGLSYIQLGRAWQIGFFAGLAIWSILVFRALWPTRATFVAGDPAILDRPHPPRASDLGIDRQYRAALCLRHDPAHRDREILHDLRLLALVGGPSLGRAVLRVLRRGDQRLFADGGWAGLAPARRARRSIWS